MPLLAAPAALLLTQGEAKAILTYYIFENAGNVEVQAVGSLILPNSIGPGVCGTPPSGWLKSNLLQQLSAQELIQITTDTRLKDQYHSMAL